MPQDKWVQGAHAAPFGIGFDPDLEGLVVSRPVHKSASTPKSDDDTNSVQDEAQQTESKEGERDAKP
jgi:hypothetical protein